MESFRAESRREDPLARFPNRKDQEEPDFCVVYGGKRPQDNSDSLILVPLLVF